MKKAITVFATAMMAISAVMAQEVPVTKPDTLKQKADTAAAVAGDYSETADLSKYTSVDTKEKVPHNIFKFNITSAIIKNYSVQYERVLSRTVSAALTARYMPETNIPYTDMIYNIFNVTDEEVRKTIDGVIAGNMAITPEIRFYTGKKRYGTGFYFSLFYQYGQYTFNNAIVNFENDFGETVEMDWSGNATCHSGGFMIGSQFALGRHVSLDWWILGPHFGISSGDVLGLSSIPLSEQDQQNIEDNLNEIDIPMFEQTVDVTSDRATMIFDGPWAGIRTGLSIGIRF